MKATVLTWTITIVFMVCVSTALCDRYTDCGGQLYSSYGILKSPGYPSNYPNNAECHWTIKANQGQVILLRFYRVDIEGSCNDFVHVYDGEYRNSTRLAELCSILSQSEVSNMRIRSTGNKLHIYFRSDFDEVRQGFIAAYWTQDCSPFTYGQDTCDETCKCVRDNSAGCDSVFGNCLCKDGWTSPTCSSAQCKFNNCTGLCNVTSTNPWKEQCLCPDWMREVTNSSGVFCLNSYDCGANITVKLHGTLTSPDYPKYYNNNFNCQWKISTSVGNVIVIWFVDLDLQYHTFCGYDSVEIFDEVVTGSRSLGKFCGNTIPGSVQSTSNNVRVVFKTDGSVTARGFYAQFKSFAYQTCQQTTLTAPPGQISSPNYPNNYENKTLKCWSIYGNGISLKFTEFDLEYDQICSLDYLQVFDGPSDHSPSLGKFCGNNLPTSTIANSGQMYLVFKTDNSNVRKGFHATYKIAEDILDLNGASPRSTSGTHWRRKSF